MNADRLYVASLRAVIHVGAFKITHTHKKYVLVKRLGYDLACFKDLDTKKKYTNLFNNCVSGEGDCGIDLVTLQTFSEATGYNEHHITKRKALALFNQKVKRMEE